MRDIFISFQSADDAIAVELTEELEKLGWSCWRCTRPTDNVPGSEWTRTLAEELIAAEVVVLLHSERSAASKYVFREISMAVSLEKPLLIVRLDDASFPPDLGYLVRTVQMLNASGLPLAQWLPVAVQALRVLLHSRCALPIDSTLDRGIKVRFCGALHRELFGDRPACYVGAAIHFPGVVNRYLEFPRVTRAQLAAVQQTLASFTHLRRTAPKGGCVPFQGAEDLFYLVLFSEKRASKEEMRARMHQLLARLADAIQEQRPAEPIVCEFRETACVWQPAEGDEALAAWLTDMLGGEVLPPPRAKVAGKTEPRLSPTAEPILARISRASIERAEGFALRLPRAMTCPLADEHLREILLTAK